MVVSWPCLVVEQLYLEDLEVKVIPVERSPPSLSSSLLSCAGTAVNRGPRRLRLNIFVKYFCATETECVSTDLVVALQSWL